MTQKTLPLFLLLSLTIFVSGCGGNAVISPIPAPAQIVTITAAQVFTPRVGDVWTFRNGYGDITTITIEAVPPSNFLPSGSINWHYRKNACRAYWGAGICDADFQFTLSPRPDGSWVSLASLYNFPTQIPDYMNGHHMGTSEFLQVPSMPVPYTTIPATATTGITNSTPTQYDRYDALDVLSFDSIVSGPASARVRWQTDSYIDNVQTPVYSGPALIGEYFESSCIHEKWYFAPGHGLVKVIPLDNGSCIPTDPMLTMERIS